MTELFSFSQYAPSISAKVTAQEICDKIWSLNPESNCVTIDMSDIIAMTTICARVIFGSLYVKLGKDKFTQNIKIIGMSDAIRIVVNWGIDSAIN